MSEFYDLEADEQCRLLERLGRVALTEWGIDKDAELRLIKHRENTIFKVTEREGAQSYALRVHRARYNTPDEIRSELQWMHALRHAGILTPEVIPTADGMLTHEARSKGVPESRTVDLFRWIDGCELGRIEDGGSDDPETLAKYRLVGATAARLHNHASAWPLPAGFTRHAWDEAGLLGGQPLWGRYWESELLDEGQRLQLTAIREDARVLLEQFGTSPDRYGLVHADLVPENLMIAGSDVYVIDFDDMGFGWHLFDLATIMFWHLGTGYYDALLRSVITGYRSQRALADDLLEWFPLFLVLRGTTYIGWCHTRRETQFARDMGRWVISVMAQLLGSGHKMLSGITER